MKSVLSYSLILVLFSSFIPSTILIQHQDDHSEWLVLYQSSYCSNVWKEKCGCVDMHKLPLVSSLLKMSKFCQEINISPIDTSVPSSFFKIIKFHRHLYSPNTSPGEQRHYIIYGFVMTHTEYLVHFLPFLLFQQYLLPICLSLYLWAIKPLKFIEKVYSGTRHTGQCSLGINEDLQVQKDHSETQNSWFTRPFPEDTPPLLQ